jgi:hypothetical protein
MEITNLSESRANDTRDGWVGSLQHRDSESGCLRGRTYRKQLVVARHVQSVQNKTEPMLTFGNF